MKLIIDIDEEDYEFIKAYNDVTLSKINQDLYKSVSNGIPLEDIKAEIQKEADRLPYRQNAVTDGMIDGLEEAIEIIDEHIKENKEK